MGIFPPDRHLILSTSMSTVHSSATESTDSQATSSVASTGQRKGRPKKVQVTPKSFQLPPVLLKPVGLVAYMSQFSDRELTIEQVIQEAVIAHLEQLHKPGPRQVEIPAQMLAAIRQFKETMHSNSPQSE